MTLVHAHRQGSRILTSSHICSVRWPCNIWCTAQLDLLKFQLLSHCSTCNTEHVSSWEQTQFFGTRYSAFVTLKWFVFHRLSGRHYPVLYTNSLHVLRIQSRWCSLSCFRPSSLIGSSSLIFSPSLVSWSHLLQVNSLSDKVKEFSSAIYCKSCTSWNHAWWR